MRLVWRQRHPAVQRRGPNWHPPMISRMSGQMRGTLYEAGAKLWIGRGLASIPGPPSSWTGCLTRRMGRNEAGSKLRVSRRPRGIRRPPTSWTGCLMGSGVNEARAELRIRTSLACIRHYRGHPTTATICRMNLGFDDRLLKLHFVRTPEREVGYDTRAVGVIRFVSSFFLLHSWEGKSSSTTPNADGPLLWRLGEPETCSQY